MSDPLEGLGWPSISTQGWYRDAPKNLKDSFRSLWTQVVAPYTNPDAFQNGVVRPEFSAWMNQFDLPAKLPDEDSIITPESLGYENGWTLIEQNPAFRQKPYDYQQAIKKIWFTQALTKNPGISRMMPSEQSVYFGKLLSRYPATSTGLIAPVDPAALQKDVENMSRAGVGALQALTNLLKGLGDTASWVINAPARALFGEGNFLTQTLMDIDKNREWYAAIRKDTSQLLTNTLPYMAGFAGGILLGDKLSTGVKVGKGVVQVGATPMRTIESLLTSTPASFSQSGQLTRIPGLLEKGAAAIGAKKLPSIAFDIAGGSIAGAVQGIGQAIGEGKPWHSNLAADMTLGVGMEAAGRYISAVRLIKQIMKTGGVPEEKLAAVMSRPFKAGDEAFFGPEMSAILKNNPSVLSLQNQVALVGPTGMRIMDSSKPEGLTLLANSFDLGITWADDGTKLTLKDGAGKIMQTFDEALPENRIKQAYIFLDTRYPLKSIADLLHMKGKGASEAFATSTNPRLKAYISNAVPESGRQFILSKLGDLGANTFDYTKTNDQAQRAVVDEIFMQLTNTDLSLKKVDTFLRSKNIDITGGQAKTQFERSAMVKQLRSDLLTMLNQPTITTGVEYVGSRGTSAPGSKDLLDPNSFDIKSSPDALGGTFSDMPKVALMSDFPVDPQVTQGTIIGDAAAIRKQLSMVKQQLTTNQATRVKAAKKSGAELKVLNNNRLVQIEMTLTDHQGNVFPVTMNFNSLDSALKTLTLGKNDIGHIFQGNQLLIEDYDSFLKKMRKEAPEQFKSDFMPFAYVKQMAAQNHFQLGWQNGRYYLQDSLNEIPTEKSLFFNDLQSVATYLKNTDIRPNTADFTGSLPISPEAIEELYKDGIPDPTKRLSTVEVPRNKRFGLSYYLASQLSPAQHFFEKAEKLAIAEQFEKIGGMGFRGFHELGRTSAREVAAFATPRNTFLKSLKKATGKKEAEYVRRLMESVTDKMEIAGMSPVLQKMPWELRSDVLQEAGEKFGQAGRQRIEEAAFKLSEYYEKLFASDPAGAKWEMFIRRYHPHIASEVRRRNVGMTSRLDMNSLTNIPKGDRQYFFELLREADPSGLALVDNPFDAAEVYTNLMARKLFVRPAIQRMGGALKKMDDFYKAKGEKPGDYLSMFNYIADMMNAIQGIQMPHDRVLAYATENTLEGVRKAVESATGRKWNSYKGRTDLIGKAIGLGISGQLAMRGYPIFKNLTQSLITGGSMIGWRWWLDGVDAVSDPKQVQRMYQLGIVKPSDVPIIGGTDAVSLRGFAEKATAMGMKGYSYADIINRTIVYTGMERRVQSALADFQAGKLTPGGFTRLSGMKLFGKPAFNEAAAMFNTGKYRELVDFLARTATDKSQFLYETFESPRFARTAIGRLAGQYTSWPINFAALLKDRIANTAFAPQSISYLARLSASSAAIAAGVYAAGLNETEWMPWNNLVASPGPYIGLITNTLAAARGDQMAAKKAIDTMVSLLPFAYAGTGLALAAQSMADGDWYAGLMHLLSAPIRTDVSPRNNLKPKELSNWLFQGYKKAQSLTKPA